MTDVAPDPLPADTQAAELALGLLNGDERAAALRRVLAEPGFAREVEEWRLRFAQLFDLWPEVEAPEGLLDRIDRSLDGVAMPRTRAFPWRLLAMVSTAVAAGLLFILPLRPVSIPVPPRSPDGPVLLARCARCSGQDRGGAVPARERGASHRGRTPRPCRPRRAAMGDRGRRQTLVAGAARSARDGHHAHPRRPRPHRRGRHARHLDRTHGRVAHRRADRAGGGHGGAERGVTLLVRRKIR